MVYFEHTPGPSIPIRRALKWSSIGHGFLLGALLIWPLLYDLMHRENPPISIMMVDINSMPGNPAPAPPAPPAPQPKPEVPKPPEPTPPQPELPKPKPEMVEKKPDAKPAPSNVVKKAEIKVSTNLVTRRDVPRPTSGPAPKSGPALTQAQIERMLSSGLPGSGGSGGGGAGGAYGTPGAVNAVSLYYAKLQTIMYDAWVTPGDLSGGNPILAVRIRRDGTIIERRLSRPSGNRSKDDSVMRAANSVSRVPPLPPEIAGSSTEITIEFVPQ